MLTCLSRVLARIGSIFLLAGGLAGFSAAAAADFSAVAKIFSDHCLDCHGVQEPDGQLVLETYELMMKGGESGQVILPGKSSESLLVKMIEGKFEKDGKVKFMPPGKRDKLKAEEIAVIRAWIDAGAKPPTAAVAAREVVVPKIEPQVQPRRAVHSLASEPKANLLALGRSGEVEIYSAEAQTLVRTLSGPAGDVNSVVFSPDGKFLFAAGGHPGLSGEIAQWRAEDGTLVRTISGHTDAIYGLAISPDGKTLASGSYDQKIKLWSSESGSELRTLTGHNGCIYAVAFRSDGKILASASGDRTVKLWDTATGERRDTLSKPLKEQYALAFSPDGKHLAAGGVDRRIRIWEISAEARETTNPLLHSKFAHEGSILKLVYSADGKSLLSSGEDKTVKVWDPAQMTERRVFPAQPDWPPAVAFILNGKGVAVGRLDGSLAFYDAQSGAVLPPPKPELARVEPRGIQRGATEKLKTFGKHLQGISKVTFNDQRLIGKVLGPDEIEVTADPAMPRGAYKLAVEAPSGKSGEVTLHVDDLPQVFERALPELPVTVWGTHKEPGQKDIFEFTAREGELLVFDAAASSIGSKADLVLTLTDAHGKVIESNNGFDRSADPLIAHRFTSGGRHQLIVQELVPAGSVDHFYRVSIGAFPFVAAVFPPVADKDAKGAVELAGFNLRPGASAELPLQLDPEQYRWRSELKVASVTLPLQKEAGTNIVDVPGIVAGRLATDDAEDWFRFPAKAGQTLIVEARAAAYGSPLDTRVEIRDHAGEPLVRTLLQAVRDSAVTFRGIDSVTVDCRVENWEEMELNQYLYLQGEVVRLFRAPQGPDSGFNFYGLNGRRRTYFDTTATSHANGEPCYIVVPHPPGANLVPNGLPVFPIYFENDDDSEGKLGSDSRVYFKAPSDGEYLARVTDSRGFNGDRYIYTVTVREAAPAFTVSIDGMNPSVARGSGQRFSVNVDRLDGFDGEIKVALSGVPSGFTISNPVVVQAGHSSASGTIFAHESAQSVPAGTVHLTATAEINGKIVEQKAGSFGEIKVLDSAPLYVTLETSSPEIIITPGGTVPANLKIRRNGHAELVTFQVDNLPHGIIVDNIGLNGVLIPKDQNEREIFLTAAKWVPETDRLCFAISNEAGRQTSQPVLVKVRRNPGAVAQNR